MPTWNIRGRGEDLENLILASNDYYHKHKVCRIDKFPTPVKVVEVEGSSKVTEGYYEKKSTVDFCGVVQGHFIAFDAKTTSGVSLPLKNVHKHQIEYMRDVDLQGGITFLLVEFSKFKRFFLLPFELLNDYYILSESGGKKSINIKDFPENLEIKYIQGIRLQYLETVNEYLDWKEEYENKI